MDYSRYERATVHPSNADEDSNNTSPDSGMTAHSPSDAPSQDPSMLPDDESCDLEDEKETSSGQAKSSTSKSKADKEKRKRSRVTPEQLAQLERYFISDRSPTAARRRDISEMLGMQERQTQIWFQNRRAKAKLQDGKQGIRRGSAESILEVVPGLAAPSEVDLYHLIHEDEPVTVIPCTDLTIGTWRRIASPANKHDLVAYVCESKRYLTWFIQSGGYGFKMDMPFSVILNTEITKIGPHTGLATFVLSQPPNFYLEHLSPPLRDGSVPRTWKRCADWTEDRQASQVLRHTIIGSDSELDYLFRSLQAYSSIADAQLKEPPYRAERMVSSPMEIPAPPLAGLAAFTLSGIPIKHPQHPMEHSRKRPSYDGQTSPYALDSVDVRPPPHSAPALSFPQNGFMRMRQVDQTTVSNFGSAVYDSNGCAPQHAYQEPRLSGFTANLIPRGQPPSHYTTQLESYTNPRALQPFQRETARLSPHVHYPTPSPPLLTTPYNPETSSNRLYNTSHRSPPREMSGMPRVMYQVDEDLRCRRSH